MSRFGLDIDPDDYPDAADLAWIKEQHDRTCLSGVHRTLTPAERVDEQQGAAR